MTTTIEETPAMLRDKIARLEANLATERQLLELQNELTATVTMHADAMRLLLGDIFQEKGVSPLTVLDVLRAYDLFIMEA